MDSNVLGLSETIAQLNPQFNSLAKFSAAYYSDMNRRDLLRALIDAPPFNGNQAEFARKIKKSPAQVHQWLSGCRALGDAGARGIELALNLGVGYFDGRKSNTESPPIDLQPAAQRHTDLLAAWDLLLPGEQAALLDDIQQKAAHNKAVLEAHAAKEPEVKTIRVVDKRKRQVHFDWPERRASKKEGGEP